MKLQKLFLCGKKTKVLCRDSRDRGLKTETEEKNLLNKVIFLGAKSILVAS